VIEKTALQPNIMIRHNPPIASDKNPEADFFNEIGTELK
jgi:hypothetical protein